MGTTCLALLGLTASLREDKLFSRPFVSLTQGAKLAEKNRKMDFESTDILPLRAKSFYRRGCGSARVLRCGGAEEQRQLQIADHKTSLSLNEGRGWVRVRKQLSVVRPSVASGLAPDVKGNVADPSAIGLHGASKLLGGCSTSLN